MPKIIDLTGKRFGRLTVVKKSNVPKGKGAKWDCICECGNMVIVKTGALNYGSTKSCGCLQKDIVRKTGYNNKVHGKSDSRLHIIWMQMRSRCESSKNNAYKYYGIRGIRVCEEWNDYITFENWALNNGYKKHLTIDRIDNDGNYEPSNCRWVTMQTQANNRRSTILITFNRKTQSLKQWSDEIGIKHGTLLNRYHRGYAIKKLLSTKHGGCK